MVGNVQWTSIMYVLPNNNLHTTHHVKNSKLRIRVKRENPRTSFETVFLMIITAVYESIFFELTAFNVLNYYN